eukprot:CAMPEP_0175039634 /NCGR_PEP_ID=MMETSP0052_2-20121109/715_1 /TAXON_ID=51329 ORGANISM="Polytomella parva, Strain SAG 63-3" /NCGR_SAMPLE_ID=MMETSP0052_2 /ASSEMBLY_ACC=CAM_ASM_000194 /LENGTH=134 /DNA_ID=CAMNT_0016301553 /DNA_START=265 /DNA_END=670 /DNA_ORIENTATION=+
MTLGDKKQGEEEAEPWQDALVGRGRRKRGWKGRMWSQITGVAMGRSGGGKACKMNMGTGEQRLRRCGENKKEEKTLKKGEKGRRRGCGRRKTRGRGNGKRGHGKRDNDQPPHASEHDYSGKKDACIRKTIRDHH